MTEIQWLASEEPDAMLEYLVGRVNHAQLVDFVRGCWERVAPFRPPAPPHGHTFVEQFAEVAEGQSDFDAATYACEAALKAAGWAPAYREERRAQAALLRRVVGNPFRLKA